MKYPVGIQKSDRTMKHTLIHTLYIWTVLLLLPMMGCEKQYPVTIKLQQAESVMNEHPDSALRLLESISYPERLTEQQQAEYALWLSLARYRCHIPATSDSLINIAVQYYKNKKDADKCATVWYTYAGIIDEIGQNSEKAIYAYKEAENHIPQMKDSTLIPLIYSNLAYLNKKALHYEQAKTYYLKAERINRLLFQHHSLASNYINLCSIYQMLHSDSTEWCVQQMLELCSLLTDSTLLAKIYHNAGVYFEYQSHPVKAKNFYRQSLLFTPNTPSYKTLAALANLYMIEGKEEEANNLFQKALAGTDLSLRASIYQNLYKDKEKEGQYSKAVLYAKEYIAATDSFFKNTLNSKVLEAQLKYDQLSLQHKSTLLEKRLYITILIASILFAVTYKIIKYYRKRQKELYSINHLLQSQIDDLKVEIREKEKNGQEIAALQKRIEQLEKLKQIYISQDYLDAVEIKAAGVMKTIVKDLKYSPSDDRKYLACWLNTYRNGFAIHLEQNYPQISSRHLDVCYLTAAGFDIKHIAHLLGLKERTIERYMTDICKKVQSSEEGKKGFQSLILKLCIHPKIKKEAENIATFTKFT